ncbi:MAG: NAD(+)/NADH kinase [Spirochaetes bacterium]|uniref:NAD kinase n=1 Tax=Candidatus Gallitreponema excrementavium TaxID=2840840 RepID=A0A9D9N1L4_9SPIR|nr:NAD(+)/NADH kinase [Candidatus Gallitreponema excrementavium]
MGETSVKKSAVAFVEKPETRETALKVKDFLEKRGRPCLLLSLTEKNFDIDFSGFSLVVTLGGDGTVLFAARRCASMGIPVFPVNFGKFGFIAGIPRNDWERLLSDYLEGRADISKRLMLEVKVVRDGVEIFSSSGLNDCVIGCAGISKIVALEVSMGKISLGEYRADGIIIATPTGSTAYSAAAGGPIVDPGLDAFVVNPVCAFSLSSRPLVIPSCEDIRIRIPSGQASELVLTVDGQEALTLQADDRVLVKQYGFKAQIISYTKEVFYDALKNKLSWSGSWEITEGSRKKG